MLHPIPIPHYYYHSSFFSRHESCHPFIATQLFAHLPIEHNDLQLTMPLGVGLTGYRLLTTGVILGFSIAKAVYSYKGQALISTTLDWLAGGILALM